MQKKLDNRGFGIVEALMAIVIVIAIGFVGWFVWHSKQSATAENGRTPTAIIDVKTFDECKEAAGSRVLDTYPIQCVTKAGKTFTGPVQAQK